MRASLRLSIAALCLVAPLLAASPRADADEWRDAKKAFRKAQREVDIKVRGASYLDLLGFDGTEETDDAIDELFRALVKEKSPAVIKAAIDALATFQSDEATAAIVHALRKGRGSRRLYALLALADKTVAGGEDVLLEILNGKEEPLVAQAALALGRKKAQAALPRLLELLEHDAWQLRAAAARGLHRMAGMPVQDPKSLEWSLPPIPDWFEPPTVVPALVQSLASAEGRARGDIVSALERITGHSFGYDLKAWERLASGTDPSQIRARPETIPHFFGIPIYGRKVVILVDISTCTDDTHPFDDLDRLKEVLSVPRARPVALPTVRTTKEVFAAHAKRLIGDLSPRGAKFDVVAVFQKIEPLFGRLTPANSGTKRQAKTFLDELTVQVGPNHFAGLDTALDISGTKESVAWSLGPDEIVLMTCNIPWAPKDPSAVVNQDEVGAAIGLKARMRMVPIHTVGVGPHPFGMMRTISEQSGGRYVDLSR